VLQVIFQISLRYSKFIFFKKPWTNKSWKINLTFTYNNLFKILTLKSKVIDKFAKGIGKDWQKPKVLGSPIQLLPNRNVSSCPRFPNFTQRKCNNDCTMNYSVQSTKIVVEWVSSSPRLLSSHLAIAESYFIVTLKWWHCCLRKGDTRLNNYCLLHLNTWMYVCWVL